jgi:hypothetical protein
VTPFESPLHAASIATPKSATDDNKRLLYMGPPG